MQVMCGLSLPFILYFLYVCSGGTRKLPGQHTGIVRPSDRTVNSGGKKALGNRESISVYAEKANPSPTMLSFQGALGFTGGGGVSAFSPFASLGQL